ncbi:MAG TPA: hypothetical protein VEA40_12515 [Ramlibacter sp.]|nr:hypothetical protein [Ramlibacter sp.]
MTVTLAFYLGTRAENPKARLFDQLVCAWPRSAGRFSHVELVGPDGVCFSSSKRDGGVRGKRIDLASGRWVLARHAGDERRALEWFFRHHGEPYDTAGLLGFVLPWRTQDRRAWFCSEAVAAALGLPRSWELSPNHLYARCTPAVSGVHGAEAA